jgi:hypothetical protein
MPTLSQMITWTLLQAPGWNRDGEKGLLPLYNEVYCILMRNETEQSIQVSNGELPSLNTTAGDYSYNLPTTIWRVTKMGFSMPNSSNYNLSTLEDYGMTVNRQRPDQYFYFAGRKYLRFPHIRTFDKDYSNPARVEFTVDPGTTTGLYLYVGHKEPPVQLGSETIEPALPEHLHQYLMQGVLKLVEALQNGNYVEAYMYINEELKPKVHAQMNLGEQGLSGHVERREF